jgi:hypothetical protein
MSKVQLHCPIKCFVECTTKHYLESAEMKKLSQEDLDAIDAVMSTDGTDRCKASEIFNVWSIDLAPWSPHVGWRSFKREIGDENEYPIVVVAPQIGEGGDEKKQFLKKLRRALSTDTVSESTLIYALMRFVALSNDDEWEYVLDGMLSGVGLELSDDGRSVIFNLYTFPDTTEPMKIPNFDTDVLGAQMDIIRDIYAETEKDLYSVLTY